MTFYRCCKPFSVRLFDADGFAMPNQYLYVIKHSIWHRTCEEDGLIRLINIANNDWIDITAETLRNNFIPKDDIE